MQARNLSETLTSVTGERGAMPLAWWNRLSGLLAGYLELTKPEVTWLILMSTGAGFYLASEGSVNVSLLIHTVFGTGLVAAGAGTLNQLLERRSDAKMQRTERRPLPTGRIAPRSALVFGLTLAGAGIATLTSAVNVTAALLALGTLVSYLFFYTPLKSRTPLCTLVGAVPGAMPPVIGWAGARGELHPEAGILFLILFLWQFPHFLAIAWMYREDYARGGMLMLPVVDPEGKATGRQILLYTAALLPVSLFPTQLGLTGQLYLFGSMALGLVFLYYAAEMVRSRTRQGARRLLLASVGYLPLVFVLMVLDKG